jgi:hypothetical protein
MIVPLIERHADACDFELHSIVFDFLNALVEISVLCPDDQLENWTKIDIRIEGVSHVRLGDFHMEHVQLGKRDLPLQIIQAREEREGHYLKTAFQIATSPWLIGFVYERASILGTPAQHARVPHSANYQNDCVPKEVSWRFVTDQTLHTFNEGLP